MATKPCQVLVQNMPSWDTISDQDGMISQATFIDLQTRGPVTPDTVRVTYQDPGQNPVVHSGVGGILSSVASNVFQAQLPPSLSSQGKRLIIWEAIDSVSTHSVGAATSVINITSAALAA